MRHVASLWFAVALSAGLIAVLLPDAGGSEGKPAAEATIQIDASKPTGKVSRFLTGACIEDVNHEIYGGLYSQMLFGESFQETGFHQPLKGFVAYEGAWTLKGAELLADGGTGPKLVSEHAHRFQGHSRGRGLLCRS